jgi:hypothetical protein
MYSDGTTADTPLSISDWTPGNLQAGNVLAFETTHRDTTAGTDTTHAAVYVVSVPVAAGKVPVWLRLGSPTSGNAAIHVFALAEDGNAGASTSQTTTAGGGVPATLALTLSGHGDFGTFVPGVDRTYSASISANAISTAADAALTVSGDQHLKNGAFQLAEPLGVSIAPDAFATPVTNAASTIAFSQHIGASESLHTGTYGTALTFTLSTTNP